MPELGRKYTCYSCHTKFYDLGKPTPVCPKCGADQRDAEEKPVTTSSRSRRVIEEPPEEPEFEAEPEPTPVVGAGEAEDEEEIIVPADREEEPEEEEEEEF